MNQVYYMDIRKVSDLNTFLYLLNNIDPACHRHPLSSGFLSGWTIGDTTKTYVCIYVELGRGISVYRTNHVKFKDVEYTAYDPNNLGNFMAYLELVKLTQI